MVKATFDLPHGQRCSLSRPQNFMGSIRGSSSIGRGYECLEYSLINMHKDIRKYTQSNFASLDQSLKSFLRSENKGMEESDCIDHPVVYQQMLANK